MIFISHRGNIEGSNPERENSLDYAVEAILRGYQVELDIWSLGDRFFLGHDHPEKTIEERDILKLERFLWFHCKNMQAFSKLCQFKAFMHEGEPKAAVGRLYDWHHSSNTDFSKRSICVMPELTALKPQEYLDKVAGVCSDHIREIKQTWLLK